MQKILKYFPKLNEQQRGQMQTILRLYPEWNDKINVVSRKDIANLEERHVLHSLAIARFITFVPGTRILDLGAGGGFPSVPLAIMFPQVQFLLVDRVAKKLRVAADIAQQAGLNNVAVQHGDALEVKTKSDFVVCRAVMPLDALVRLARKLVRHGAQNSMPNGIISLKGGELDNEIANFRKKALVEDISTYFDEDFFQTKKIIYLPI